jgi:demethylmenaquinone methyltransferase/2-methoxy-6-polyprenyl-1,4-benzoquinol methylase
MLREAIEALDLPLGSRGLDAGCGIGLPALLLVEAVGSAGHVIGLDISSDFLIYAEDLAKKSDLGRQISFKQGDVSHLPFEDKSLDWLWSCDCAGYPSSSDPLPQLKELMRVIKPGGTIALLAWSSQQLLPGYPLLEARLNAASSSIIPYVKGKRPESNFVRTLGWFFKAGLQECRAQTIVGTAFSPLSEDIRRALICFFDMLWGKPQAGESKEDRDEYLRLCLPGSPDFILNLPDYYAFYTYSMFQARVPG